MKWEFASNFKTKNVKYIKYIRLLDRKGRVRRGKK